MGIPIKSILAGVRSYLGFPDYANLPNHMIMERLYDRLDYLRTLLNLTNQNFFLSRTRIDVDSSTDEYLLNFNVGPGRPVLCHTIDDSNPQHVTREVQIVNVQDNDLYYIGPKQGAGMTYAPHVAQTMNIFYDLDAGFWKVKVVPQHLSSASYQLWIQPDRPTPPTLTANFPLMENFIGLVKVSTALSCLPMLIKGSDPNALAFIERRLMADEARYQSAFDVYKTMAHLEELGSKRGFATDCDWGW